MNTSKFSPEGAPQLFRKGLYGGRGEIRREQGKPSKLGDDEALFPFGSEQQRAAFRSWFGGDDPLEVEIGFGHGHFLSAHCEAHNDRRFLGIEVRTKFCRELLESVRANGSIGRVRIVQADARPILAELVSAGRLSAVHVNFPDPWWKKRHHKRRVLCEKMVQVLWRALRADGAVWFRTDVAEYAERVVEMFEGHGGFSREPFAWGVLAPTFREVRCEEFGLDVYRYRFVRRPV